MIHLFLDSLDETRRKIFNDLKGFSQLGVLGGGTAISLQIGHRRSFDFDIFTFKPFPTNLWAMIRKTFGKGCLRTLDTADQLDLITPNKVAVTFFFDDYKLLFPPLKTNPINVMDLRDLACNKAFTIGRRGKWRDYVDLYFLIKEGKVSLNEIIQLSEKKFQGEFPVRLFLQQLSYFDDITDYTIDFLRDEASPEEIKHYLTGEVQDYRSKSLQLP